METAFHGGHFLADRLWQNTLINRRYQLPSIPTKQVRFFPRISGFSFHDTNQYDNLFTRWSNKGSQRIVQDTGSLFYCLYFRVILQIVYRKRHYPIEGLYAQIIVSILLKLC